MPAQRDMLNQDTQLARRVIPIELPRLSQFNDIAAVRDMIAFYADAAELAWPDSPAAIDTAARLIHAADREFGLAIEVIMR